MVLTLDDVDLVREILGSGVFGYDDTELLTPTRLLITEAIIVGAIPDAVEETDPDRLVLIDAAQAYLIGMDLVGGDLSTTSSKLGDSTISYGDKFGKLAAYWRGRYLAMIRRLRGEAPSGPAPTVALAHGRRG